MSNNDLFVKDPDIFNLLKEEFERQNSTIELIASENFTSMAVMQAQGSVLTNKYAEGYPDHRYYGGCSIVDKAEKLAIERAKRLFGCEYVNVQPHSGSQANQAVFLALINPGDTILGMKLDSGGHLTHGAKPNLSGKWFKAVHYGVNKDNYLVDYDEVERLAKEHSPKIIVAGYSAYSRHLDFKRFRDIADKVGAYLLADISHIAGLVATGLHSSPFPHAQIVTTTTHKTLRGPRGGMIMSNDHEIAKKIDMAIFPGLQGGPMMHTIAAKAVAFKEALTEDYRAYIKQVVDNSKVLADNLIRGGYQILTGGTDNHIVLVDLRPKGISGLDAEKLLEEAGITCNKNAIAFDKTSPRITSGIRLGTPACTTRGFKAEEFKKIAELIVQVLDCDGPKDETKKVISKVREEVKKLCENFPLYPDFKNTN